MLVDSDYYKIDKEKGITFFATHILVLLDKTESTLSSADLRGNRQIKEATLALQEKGFVSQEDYKYYITAKGKEKADTFQARYSSILTYLDIFGLIDLEKGEFAFQKFGTFASDQEWNEYSSDSRWSDLRIAMIDHLDGDATELVFAQMSLESHIPLADLSCQEISDLCDNAIQEEDLSYKDGSKLISGSDVLDDIYDKAVELLKSFHPDDSEILYNLNTWYSEPDKPIGYGSSIKISSKSKPLWESPWSL